MYNICAFRAVFCVNIHHKVPKSDFGAHEATWPSVSHSLILSWYKNWLYELGLGSWESKSYELYDLQVSSL